MKHRVREIIFFTLVLLCLLLYVFANALTQLSKETDLEAKYFATVADSMYTLLVYGARPGEWGACLDDFAREDPCLGFAFAAFMVLTVLLLVNMLARVLSELVGVLAPVGCEAHRQAKVKGEGQRPQLRTDRDAGGTISQEELCGILSDRAATRALTELGVDAAGLAGLADASFALRGARGSSLGRHDAERAARLGFCALVEAAIQSRGTDRVTTRDVAVLQSSFEHLLREQQQEVQVILEGLTALCARGPKIATDADGTTHGNAPTVLY